MKGKSRIIKGHKSSSQGKTPIGTGLPIFFFFFFFFFFGVGGGGGGGGGIHLMERV